MKNCDFRQVMTLIFACFVLSQFGSVETAALAECPPQQVLHFNPATNIGICCKPVPLPKGFGFKSCTRNGTNDTIEVCPKMPLQLYQWDDTTTASEATCIAEMQCLDVENKMIKKCEENGQNCHNECVCNFPGGYCGTEYFNCNPFPVGCPRDNVQEDCSCRSPGLEPEKRSGKSDLDVPNSITPITSVSKLPSSSATGISDKKIEGDQTPDVGIMKEKDNNNDTVSETKPEESLRSPGLEPEKRSGKSDLDVPNSITPITSVSKLPSSSATGISDKKIEGDQTPDVGIMKEKDNNNDTVSETKPEESLRSPGLEPEKRSGKSDLDVPNSITPITSVSKLPSSSATGISDKKIEGDQTPDVGIMKEKDNNNDTVSETKPEESLSIGSIIGIAFAVIVVICGLLFYILRKDRYKQLWGKCKGDNQDSVQPKPVQKVKPFYLNSSEHQDEEAQSLQRQVTGQDEPAEQELVAQPILSEEPQLNLSVNWPTLGNSLFDSHNSMANQQEVSIESGRDQTHVKDVINGENLVEEEGHHSGAVDNSSLCHVGVEPTLAPERDEGEEL